MNKLAQTIEALLFYKNEPVSFSWLAEKIQVAEEDIRNTVQNMQNYYDERGFELVLTEDKAALVTTQEVQTIIQELEKEHQGKELSKQALETLAIIVYKQKVTKPEIDYIRGVNSVFILRNLLVRGLISKKQNTLDRRSPFYVVTHDLLSHLGISSLEKLPNYNLIQDKLTQLEIQQHEEEQREVKQLQKEEE